jgi:death on curing protein
VLLFYGMNGYDLTATEDERVDLIVASRTGGLSEVEETAEHLARGRSGSDQSDSG